MNIPEQVKNEARWLIEQYGDFLYKFPEDVTTGFPFVFRYGDGPVMTFSDFEALDLINLFIKNFDEIGVE